MPFATTARSGPWLEYADVRQAGFDPQALRAVCERADHLRSGALMIVFRGHVVLACGDVERPFETHSVRKSLVSGLYGTAVGRGEIDLNATLASFAIDDDSPLTPTERSATIRQVISARSGIYLPAAYAPTAQDRRPARGSHSPGSHWFYNNWDFNVAGVVYERATGEDLYASFDAQARDAPRHGGLETGRRFSRVRADEVPPSGPHLPHLDARSGAVRPALSPAGTLGRAATAACRLDRGKYAASHGRR